MVDEQGKTPTPETKTEKQTNCLSCNKQIRKIKRYYRNGKFYCSKKCWRNFIKKSNPR